MSDCRQEKIIGIKLERKVGIKIFTEGIVEKKKREKKIDLILWNFEKFLENVIEVLES